MDGMSKVEVLEYLGISYPLFMALMKKYKVRRVRKNRLAYYDKNAIEEIRKELELRKNIRVSNWANGVT